jgi:hypothetical protein
MALAAGNGSLFEVITLKSFQVSVRAHKGCPANLRHSKTKIADDFAERGEPNQAIKRTTGKDRGV